MPMPWSRSAPGGKGALLICVVCHEASRILRNPTRRSKWCEGAHLQVRSILHSIDIVRMFGAPRVLWITCVVVPFLTLVSQTCRATRLTWR